MTSSPSFVTDLPATWRWTWSIGRISARGCTRRAQQAASAGAVRHQGRARNLLALYHRDRGELDRAMALLAENPIQHLSESPGPEMAQWFFYRGVLAGSRRELDNAERLCF